jgi:hypothetical protein
MVKETMTNEAQNTKTVTVDGEQYQVEAVDERGEYRTEELTPTDLRNAVRQSDLETDWEYIDNRREQDDIYILDLRVIIRRA